MRQPSPNALAFLEFLRRYLNVNHPNFQIPQVEGFSYGPYSPTAGASAQSTTRQIEFNQPSLQREFERISGGGKATNPYTLVAPLHELGHLSGPPTGIGADAHFWEEGLQQVMAQQAAIPLARLFLQRGAPQSVGGIYPENVEAVVRQAANIGHAMTHGERRAPRFLYDQAGTKAGRRFVSDQVPLSNPQRVQYRSNVARVARNEEGAPTPAHSSPKPKPKPRPKVNKPLQAKMLARQNRARALRNG